MGAQRLNLRLRRMILMGAALAACVCDARAQTPAPSPAPDQTRPYVIIPFQSRSTEAGTRDDNNGLFIIDPNTGTIAYCFHFVNTGVGFAITSIEERHRVICSRSEKIFKE